MNSALRVLLLLVFALQAPVVQQTTSEVPAEHQNDRDSAAG